MQIPGTLWLSWLIFVGGCLLYCKRKIRGKTAGCAGKGDRTAAETEQKGCSPVPWRCKSKSEAGWHSVFWTGPESHLCDYKRKRIYGGRENPGDRRADRERWFCKMPYQLSGQFFLCEGMHEKEIAAGKWKNGGCQQKLLEKDGRCLCGMDEAVGEVGKE